MTVAESIRTMTSKLASAMRHASTVTDEIARLRATISAKRAELAHAREAPLPLEEIRGRIAAHVREAGELWLRAWGSSLIGGEDGLGNPDRRGSARLPWSYNAAPPWGAVCAANPRAAESFLFGLVERVAYEPGPALAERPAVITRLEAELAELERAEEAVVDEACAAGVKVEHRPEVLERRQAEARRREVEERAVADRYGRQAALDAQHERRRSKLLTLPAPPDTEPPNDRIPDGQARAGRSAYLGRP